MRPITILLTAIAASLPLVAPALASTVYLPIPPGPATVLPDFIGSPTSARPLPSAGVPQNPGMAPIPFSYLHKDSWNSDTSNGKAPLGRNPKTFSSSLGLKYPINRAASTDTFAFDSRGRLFAAFVGPGKISMLQLDPKSLAVLAEYRLDAMGTEALGNAYFFIDSSNRIVVGKGSNQVVTLASRGTSRNATLEPVPGRQYDLRDVVPSDDRLAGLLTDWKGRIWFQTGGKGSTYGPRVGVIIPGAQPIVKYVQLDQGELCMNGLAVTREGGYVVTSKQMYKIVLDADNQPRVAWQAPYDTTGTLKPGQYSLGSGTSPTILGKGHYVAITDNAVPMKVVVYRTKTDLRPGENRILGSLPVFEDMAGQATENSLVGYRNSLIIENCYGYAYGFAENGDLISNIGLPGFERVDITPDGKLTKVWANGSVAANTVPTLSTKTGLIYFVEGQQDNLTGANVYYWTALDFRSGQVIWRKLLGTGVNFDGYWSTTELGPNGTYYVGAYGGVAAIKDGW